MVPDKFNMVDMGGIDLIMMQGEEVPGLYNRLVESIAQCRYQCLYNWFFDGVVIPPSYVKMEVNENDEIAINEGVTVSSDDIIHIYSVEPAPVDPNIIPLMAEENGVYTVPDGVDGFNPVTVDVSSADICSIFTGSYGGNDASIYLVKLHIDSNGITILEPLYNLSFYPFYRGEIDHYDFGGMVRIRYISPNWYVDAIGDRKAFYGVYNTSGTGSFASGQNIFSWHYQYCAGVIVR